MALDVPVPLGVAVAGEPLDAQGVPGRVTLGTRPGATTTLGDAQRLSVPQRSRCHHVPRWCEPWSRQAQRFAEQLWGWEACGSPETSKKCWLGSSLALAQIKKTNKHDISGELETLAPSQLCK